MGLFDKIKEPVILKESSNAKEQLQALEQLLVATNDPKTKSLIETDISYIKSGILGEDRILYELKNSHIPMFVLHDIYLEFEELTAQIDFLIITRKLTYVIECKNLYGNITINNSGDFIRTIGAHKEGIYSPITQLNRHIELIKQIRLVEQGNFLSKIAFDRAFYNNYRGIVVLSNPKTILNAQYAPKIVKDRVIRSDQLIEYIRKHNSNKDVSEISEKYMKQIADFFLSKNSVCKVDYAERYKALIHQPDNFNLASGHTARKNVDDVAALMCPRCGSPMIKRKASHGDNAGKEFWGCSRFPKCREIINLK